MSALPQRFWDKVNIAGHCWRWRSGAARSDGYGQFWDGRTMRPAHRFAYEAIVGPVPEGMVLDHLCRVRDCVNPDHLEVVTQGENQRRGARGLALPGKCRSGRHDVTDPSSVVVLSGDTLCRECRIESRRRAQARYRANRRVRAA